MRLDIPPALMEQEGVDHVPLEWQIQAYADKWERIKEHPKNQDVPKYKQFLIDLLTRTLVDKERLVVVAEDLGVSRQRVLQLIYAFRRYQEGKGTFGY